MGHSRERLPPFQVRAFHFLKKLAFRARDDRKPRDAVSPVAIPSQDFQRAHSSLDLLRKPDISGLIGFRVEDSPNTMDTDDSSQDASASGNSPRLRHRRHSAWDTLHAAPAPVTASSATHTITSLARLPAAEIIKLANSSSATGLPPKADPLVVKATDEFIDGLIDKPIQTQKQQLGDKLFRAIKSYGIKGVPKLTIALLDQDDLRALAHLMNSYPSVLKEKALILQASQGGK